MENPMALAQPKPAGSDLSGLCLCPRVRSFAYLLLREVQFVDSTFAGRYSVPDSLFSWQESFWMPISNWVALLSIAHRFKFTDAESRTQREVFQHSLPLDPVKQIFLAEKHSVPISFVIPVL